MHSRFPFLSSVMADDQEQYRLTWERLCRYAGRAFDSKEDISKAGVLMVKGLKSMWRQAPPVVRNTLQGVLTRIIMQVPIPSLGAFVLGKR